MQYVLRLKASVLDYFIKLFPKKRGGLHLRPSVGTLFIRPVRKLEERERERQRQRQRQRQRERQRERDRERKTEREKGGVGRKAGG